MIIYYIIPTINTHKRKKGAHIVPRCFSFFSLSTPCDYRLHIGTLQQDDAEPPGRTIWTSLYRSPGLLQVSRPSELSTRRRLVVENHQTDRELRHPASLPAKVQEGIVSRRCQKVDLQIKRMFEKMKCWFKLYIFIRYSVLHHVHSIILPGSVQKLNRIVSSIITLTSYIQRCPPLESRLARISLIFSACRPILP